MQDAPPRLVPVPEDAEPRRRRRLLPGRGGATAPRPRRRVTTRGVRRVAVARELDVDASVAFAWVADPRTHPRFIPSR